MKKNWFIFVIFLIVVDQLSKLLVQLFIPVNTSIKIVPDLLLFTHVTNDGISFGWNPFSNSIILFFVSLVACIFIIKVLMDSESETKLNQISLCLIIGGAIGNLIDRFFTAFNLFSGAVTGITIKHLIFNFLQANATPCA